MLVALSLMALLSIMAYQGVSAMVTARDIVRKSTANTFAMQSAFTQWSQDWNASSGLRMRPGVQFTGNGIRMVRLDPSELGQVVAWRTTSNGLERLAWSPSSQPAALRLQWDATWTWIQLSTSPATFSDGNHIARVTKWPMLNGMTIYYHLENAWGNPYSSDNSDGWPNAVRLEVNSPDGAVTLDWINPNIASVANP